jgi:hypothetical protein
MMRQIISVIGSVALVAAACSSSSDPPSTTQSEPVTTSMTATPPPSTTTSQPATTTSTVSPPSTTTTAAKVAIPSGGSAFGAELTEVPLITEGTYGGPTWPTSLSGVAFVDEVPTSLQGDLLANGFAIEPNTDTYEFGVDALTWSTQFSSTYEVLSPYGGRAVFVTTDVAYHLWHQVFDLVLRETEEKELLPVLERFVASLVDATRSQSSTLAGTPVEDAAIRAREHVEAVATVLDLDVGAIGARAQEEVALVEQHTELAVSPTVGGSCGATASCVDYSLMKPRGHYTRTEDLTRFFKAMSMLGNTGFSVNDVETLRVGLLIAGLITNDTQRTADWSTIYDPTAFLVGTADDYTPIEAAVAADAVLDGGLSDPAALAPDANVAAVGEELLAMREVRIDPGRASLRTMGARFVLDSWIYDQLTDPSVARRLRPTPLDLASVMGSTYAASIQDAAGVPVEYPDYEPKVSELHEVVEARTIEDWGRTVYDGWLYTLVPMWAEQHAGAFPPFMGADAWRAKAHNTGFSSYVELKHDTILYAKQGMVEGDAPEPPPPPRHWVEPNPVAFGRLASLAHMMRDGLIDAELMLGGGYDSEAGDPLSEGERTRWAIDYLIDMLERLARIASDELAGEPISAQDNDWLSHIGSEIGWLIEAINRGELEPTPLVADIFLDPFSEAVLEIATGPLDTIHVLVPDDEGRFQVATGSVYSYYEFWGPRSDRLSDEEWWDRITEDDLRDRPSWWLDEHG